METMLNWGHILLKLDAYQVSTWNLPQLFLCPLYEQMSWPVSFSSEHCCRRNKERLCGLRIDGPASISMTGGKMWLSEGKGFLSCNIENINNGEEVKYCAQLIIIVEFAFPDIFCIIMIRNTYKIMRKDLEVIRLSIRIEGEI